MKKFTSLLKEATKNLLIFPAIGLIAAVAFVIIAWHKIMVGRDISYQPICPARQNRM